MLKIVKILNYSEIISKFVNNLNLKTMEKIFCGSGRIVNSKFGLVPKISLSKDDINKIVKYMKENSLQWVNLEMLEKKDKQEKKPTHYLVIDTWKPEKKQDKKNDSELPF